MKGIEPEELQRIKQLETNNDRFEELFDNARSEWTKKIDPIFNVVKGHFSSADSDRIIESQAMALGYRQELQEEIAKWLNRIARENTSIKELKAQKFIFYSTGFPIKTNTSEKGILIEYNIRENQRTVKILEVYVEFLRECVNNLESFGYSVKNIIALLEYLGK